jgi:long-chain acyl-CoA synthetase
VYEKYAEEIEMMHTPEGKKPDSDHNIAVLQKLLIK